MYNFKPQPTDAAAPATAVDRPCSCSRSRATLSRGAAIPPTAGLASCAVYVMKSGLIFKCAGRGSM